MVPSTWLTLLLFLFVVSPGILFDLLGAQRHVRAAESTFREIGRVVLGSIGFTSLAIALLLLVRLVVPAAMPDPRSLITGGTDYFAAHYVLFSWPSAARPCWPTARRFCCTRTWPAGSRPSGRRAPGVGC